MALRSRIFRPPEGIEVGLATAYRAGRSRRVLVQLHAHPDPCERVELQFAGIRLLSYLGSRTWYATITDAAAFNAGRLRRNVRWMGRIDDADRVAPDLRRFLASRGAPGGSGEFSVTWFRDAEEKEKGEALRRVGIKKPIAAIGSTNTTLLSMPYESVASLAATDAVKWIERVAAPGQAESDRARAFIQVDAAQTAGLTGDGVIVGVFEGAHVADGHVALSGRVTRGDTDAWDRGWHTTMMGGLIAGSGAGSPGNNWRGMAPAATIVTFDYYVGANPTDAQQHTNFASDLQDAIENHAISIASNSWGTFGCVDWGYGNYEGLCDDLDAAVRGAHGRPVVIVFSGGNERNGYWDGTGNNLGCITDTVAPFANYQTINHPKAAKNILTIGAVDSANDRMTDYSCWGPASDGRLKPELVAAGHHNGTLSSGVTLIDNPYGDPVGAANQQGYRAANWPTTNFVYGWASQTSAAAAETAGATALMLEAWRTRLATPVDPLPSTVKALLVHTARDLDDATAWYNPGPDYASGYGVVQVDDAIALIGTGRHLEGKVVQGGRKVYTLTVPAGATSFRATLAWDDPPAAVAAASALVNDLDLVVTDPGGTRHYPWTLDGANPGNVAVRTQENRVDNLEQVFVDAGVAAGTWTIAVEGFALGEGPQRYSLVADQPLASQVDIVCVLDRSGSMGGIAAQGQTRSKIEVLRDAVTQFIDIMRKDAGDRLGLVQFNQDIVAFAAGSDADLAGLTTPRATTLTTTTVPGIAHGGLTSIGDGLEAARTQLLAVAAPGRTQSILLVTDGMENQPLWISDVRTALINEGVGVYSLGLGYGSGIDADKLSELAADTGATYRVTADNLEFRKLFIEALAGAVDWSVIVDPPNEIGADEIVEIPVVVAPDEHLITFTVLWEGADDAVSFTLVTPGGRTITPTTTAQGLRSGARARYAYYQVDLPLGGALAEEWRGVWKMRLEGTGRIAAGAKVSCAASAYAEGGVKLGITFPRKIRYAGERLRFRATLRRGGKPLSGAAIHCFASVPVQAPGNVIRDAKLTGAELKGIQPLHGDSLSNVQTRLRALGSKLGRAPLARKQVAFMMHDDGRHDDGEAGDGVYATEFKTTKIAGAYTIRIVASDIPACGKLKTTREWTVSTHLGPQPDADATAITVTPVDPGAGGTVTVTVGVTPMDGGGNVLGADHSVYLTRVGERNAGTPIVLEDKGDGSYEGRVTAEPGTKLQLVVGKTTLRTLVLPAAKR